MAVSPTYKWYKVAESTADFFWQENGLCEIVVNGKTICVAKTASGVRACFRKCPHAGGRLSDGYVDALGQIVCPLHRYKFNLQNGRNSSGEGYYLRTYPVEEREDGIYIGLEEKGFFG